MGDGARLMLRTMVGLAVLAAVVAAPIPARAVTCTTSGPDFNYAIAASPGTSITSAKGVRGFSKIRAGSTIHLEAYGGAHIESLYLWNDYSNFVEYGWAFERNNLTTHGPIVFDSLQVDGDYRTRNDIDPVGTGDHKFTIVHEDSADSRFNFAFDGANQPYHRDPYWTTGRPWAVGEIGNQCDDGIGGWWSLSRTANAEPITNWTDWNNTHWNCDKETDYGYQQLSQTQFKTVDVADTYAQMCDQFA